MYKFLFYIFTSTTKELLKNYQITKSYIHWRWKLKNLILFLSLKHVTDNNRFLIIENTYIGDNSCSFKVRRDLSFIFFFFFLISTIWRFPLSSFIVIFLCYMILFLFRYKVFNWKCIVWLYLLAFKCIFHACLRKIQNILAPKRAW